VNDLELYFFSPIYIAFIGKVQKKFNYLFYFNFLFLSDFSSSSSFSLSFSSSSSSISASSIIFYFLGGALLLKN